MREREREREREEKKMDKRVNDGEVKEEMK